jgi:segregation and condensation protein B
VTEPEPQADVVPIDLDPPTEAHAEADVDTQAAAETEAAAEPEVEAAIDTEAEPATPADVPAAATDEAEPEATAEVESAAVVGPVESLDVRTPEAEPEPAAEVESAEPLDVPAAEPPDLLDLPADDVAEVEDDGLPPLAEDSALANALEALLLVVDSPAADESLADALEQPVARVRETLKRMSAELAERGSGIDLRYAGDGWRFVTRDRYAPFVEKLLLDGQRAKLTRAALETLAVIAYRQPVTRARVAAVRGVNVDGVIRTLVTRGLIGETGTDSDTGGILYRTTELFLERLGLSSLEDLPAIAPLLPEVDAIDDV